MDRIEKAMQSLDHEIGKRHHIPVIPFEEFLQILSEDPDAVLRNVFQIFHDMIKAHVKPKADEYPDDPETIQFINYDFNELFVSGADHPFFADRLFGNRLIHLAESMRRGAQQNKMYIFEGPPGCGKSTFLNNLLAKFEEYAKTPEGLRYEVVWRLKRETLNALAGQETMSFDEQAVNDDELWAGKDSGVAEQLDPDFPRPKEADHLHQTMPQFTGRHIEVPCPSHDHPILMIPKHYRRQFMDDLFINDEFKWKIFTEKEYQWLFRESACTICSSIYWALLNRLKSVREVFRMLYARPYQFNRRLGEGISVLNPGDKPLRQYILSNPMLQTRINGLLRDSNQVKYLFSRYAKTNNGIYALMDIKSHNIERLIELHNIVSEGLHKVEDIEENVNSLLISLMNPEDKQNIQNLPSFSDRIEYINIPYVLDLNTEVDIYRNIFGRHIEGSFLPRVLHNFARVIISSRLNAQSEAMAEWIGDPKKYKRYCDANLLLLKMEIYTGYIPGWLTEEDRKRFTARRRRSIIEDSLSEGVKGFSGRDSIKIFSEFYHRFARQDGLIDMSNLFTYFKKVRKDLSASIPEGFLESLLDMYDYTILQEVKESLYDYNEQQISRALQNYLFAINFETGTVEKCTYTGDKLEIGEDFFKNIEDRLLGSAAGADQRQTFRKDVQKQYSTATLPQEIMLEGLPVTETKLYQSLLERYVFHLKEKVLDPIIKNENFRQAIKDFDEESFQLHDKKIRADVTFLINNLYQKCRYTQKGAKEVCIYVIDKDLATKFDAS
jgi:predicted Ser/Thr protein kinase